MDKKKIFKIYESFFVFILYQIRRDIFGSALEGMGQEEKRGMIEHLARRIAPGALLVVRSTHGERTGSYTVVELDDLKGFDVLSDQLRDR